MEMDQNVNQNKVLTRTTYAFGAFGHDLFNQVMNSYFIMFVTNHLFNGSDTAANNRMIGIMTTIIFVLRIAELFIDPFIGNTIDKTNTKWGKFKPWVIIGTLVSGACMMLLFSNLWGLTESPFMYLFVFTFIYIIMDIFFSFKDIGLWSMLPALSFDSLEREKTATIARIGSTLGGTIVTVTIIPVILFFSNSNEGGTGDSRGWFIYAAIAAIIAILGALSIGFGTREVESPLRENKEETGFKQVLGVLVHNDQLMWLSFAYLLYGMGAYLTNSLMLYYFTYVLGHAAMFSILGMANMVIGLLAVSMFPALAKKFKRRNVFVSCIVILLVALALFSFADKNVWLVILAGALFNLPQPLIFLVVLMTFTDIVEYGQLKLGHRDESLVLSVRPLIDKCAGAVVTGITGMTAVLAGMSGNAKVADITASNVLTFKMIMVAAPAVAVLIGTFIFLKKVKITEEKHAEIVAELEKTWNKNESDK